MNNEEARYGGVAMFYHWAMVVLVVIVGTLGLLHDSWPHATVFDFGLFHIDPHVSSNRAIFHRPRTSTAISRTGCLARYEFLLICQP